MVSSVRGPKGDKGDRGEPLSRPLRRALVWLFLLAVALSVTSGAITLIYVHVSQDAQRHQAQAQQAAQRRAGLALERQLCTTFGKAAALTPPAGNPRKNPSRKFLQGQHAVWTEVVADLHCDQLPRI